MKELEKGVNGRAFALFFVRNMLKMIRKYYKMYFLLKKVVAKFGGFKKKL